LNFENESAERCFQKCVQFVAVKQGGFLEMIGKTDGEAAAKLTQQVRLPCCS
jgi:hypothetical protein